MTATVAELIHAGHRYEARATAWADVWRVVVWREDQRNPLLTRLVERKFTREQAMAKVLKEIGEQASGWEEASDSEKKQL